MTGRPVKTRQDFIDHLIDLMLDINVESDVYHFLQSMADWLKECEGFYRDAKKPVDVEQPSWELFADAISVAAVYE